MQFWALNIETGDENLRLINAHFWDSYGNHTSKNEYSPNCLGSYGHFKVLYIFVAHLAQILWRKVQKISFFNFFKFVKKTLCVCPPPPWPYLWTNFETKGTYGLPMTQGWLQKYKILKFRKIKKKFLKNFPPSMPLHARRASVGRRRRPWSE